eukprot:gene8143-9013_t
MHTIQIGNNQITDFHVESSEDSDSSTDVFIELAEAWSFVKKWYGVRKGPRQSSSNNSVSFQKGKSRVTRREPKATQRVCFQDLSFFVQIKIFSYLDVRSLSKASMVSRLWYNLSNDEMLWKRKLEKDLELWNVIDHLSHPDLYKDTDAELSSKEIYLNCCPDCGKQKQKSNFRFHLPKFSFYFGFSVPKVVMFGPGLESKTSGIVRKMFSDSMFTIKGMFPGEFEGTGSGVSLQFDGGMMNLITLYSASKREREANLANGVRRNKFLVERDEVDAEEGLQDENVTLTLTQPVKDLCSTVDAFIFVVDSTQNEQRVELGLDELKAVMGNRQLKSAAPLLVLSCVADEEIRAHPTISVANKLNLRELNRPWQVRSCEVSTLSGLLPGVQWLIHEVMNS